MNPLERLMYVSGDKPPKKMPTRQPMWNQGYTEPSVNTATPRLPVSRPTTYDDYNPQAYKYFGTNGAIKTDWSRENDVRYNAKVDNELKARYDNQGLAQLGKFAGSVISDPIALGMSAYDFAQDPSWLNAGALGLDAFTPGNVGGFLKGLGEIGIAGAAAREFAKKSIGRVATNLINTQNYGNKLGELAYLYKKEGAKPIFEAIKNDKPIYQINTFAEAEGEFPYRTMFGQEPRPISKENINAGKMGHFPSYPVLSKQDEMAIPLPIKQADGTYTLDKNSETYGNIMRTSLFDPRSYGQGEIPDFTVPQRKSANTFLLGGYNIQWNPETGTFTANDRWDFDWNKGELKSKWRDIKKSYEANVKHGVWKPDPNYKFNPEDDFDIPPGEWEPLDFKGKVRFAKNTINQDLMPLALRYAMSKITDPITYRIPIGLNDLPDINRRRFDQEISNQFLRKFGRQQPMVNDDNIFDVLEY